MAADEPFENFQVSFYWYSIRLAALGSTFRRYDGSSYATRDFIIYFVDIVKIDSQNVSNKVPRKEWLVRLLLQFLVPVVIILVTITGFL